MYKYLINNYDIQSNKIIKETKSKNTIDNAKETVKIVNKLKVKKIFIVSSEFHINRVKLIFNHFLTNI